MVTPLEDAIQLAVEQPQVGIAHGPLLVAGTALYIYVTGLGISKVPGLSGLFLGSYLI
jgi:hypothetical protein